MHTSINFRAQTFARDRRRRRMNRMLCGASLHSNRAQFITRRRRERGNSNFSRYVGVCTLDRPATRIYAGSPRNCTQTPRQLRCQCMQATHTLLPLRADWVRSAPACVSASPLRLRGSGRLAFCHPLNGQGLHLRRILSAPKSSPIIGRGFVKLYFDWINICIGVD